LTVARVLMWSERLALVEIIVPMMVILITHAGARWRRFGWLRSTVAHGGPYLAIPVLFALFTVTEYFRSWKSYSHTQTRPLFEFMASRLVTYYFTALNNGAGMLRTSTDDWPTFHLLYTVNWLYQLPGGAGEAIASVVGVRESPTALFLNNYADPEFNNMSGIFPIIYDLGTSGGAIYFALFGFIAGLLYRSMVLGGKIGGILYPILFVGIVEIFRITYLNSSRTVLLVGGALVLLSQMRAVRLEVSDARR